MIDLDDFKAFNDRNGHLAGDAVLRGVAAVLQSELRQNLDIAARYGGEEFAVILPNTPMAAPETQLEMDLAGELVAARGGEEPPRRRATGRAPSTWRSASARGSPAPGSWGPTARCCRRSP